MTNFEILFDSDGLVALFLEHDAHHQLTARLFRQLMSEERRMAVSNFIVAETATVISAIADQKYARDFLTFISAETIPVLQVDSGIEQRAISLFSAQDQKRTSIFDCMNMAVMEAYDIPTIFSFDHFYQRFNLQMIADLGLK